MVTHEIGRKKDGSRIVKNFFFNNDKTNYMNLANSYFTREERKKAKATYKYVNN